MDHKHHTRITHAAPLTQHTHQVDEFARRCEIRDWMPGGGCWKRLTCASSCVLWMRHVPRLEPLTKHLLAPSWRWRNCNVSAHKRAARTVSSRHETPRRA